MDSILDAFFESDYVKNNGISKIIPFDTFVTISGLFQLEGTRENFNQLSDGSATITKASLKKWLMSNRNKDEILSSIAGVIGVSTQVPARTVRTDEEYLSLFFDIFDLDKSGTIDKPELRALLFNLPPLLAEEDIETSLTSFESVNVNKEQFKRIYEVIATKYREHGFNFGDYVRNLVDGYYGNESAESGLAESGLSESRKCSSRGGIQLESTIKGTSHTWGQLATCLSSPVVDGSRRSMGIHDATDAIVDLDGGFTIMCEVLHSQGVGVMPLTHEENDVDRFKHWVEGHLVSTVTGSRFVPESRLPLLMHALADSASYGQMRHFQTASRRSIPYTGTFSWYTIFSFMDQFPELRDLWLLTVETAVEDSFDAYLKGEDVWTVEGMSCGPGVTERLPLTLSRMIVSSSEGCSSSAHTSTPESIRLKRTLLLTRWIQLYLEQTDAPSVEEFRAFAITKSGELNDSLTNWDDLFDEWMKAECNEVIMMSRCGGKKNTRKNKPIRKNKSKSIRKNKSKSIRKNKPIRKNK